MCFRSFLLKISLTLLFLSSIFNGKQSFGQHYFYEDSTRWEVGLPLWVPGFKGAFTLGDITIGGGDNEGNGGDGFFSQIFDSELGLDYYLVGEVRYSVKKWAFFADVFGGQIKHSTIFKYNGETLANTKIEAIIPRLIVSYRILDWDFKNQDAGSLQSYVYTGVKFFHASVNSELPDSIPPLEFTSNWVEPVLGLTLAYYWRKFTIGAKADTAPFKLFSEPAWWYEVQARYRFGKRVSVELGWVRQDFTRVGELLNQDLKLDFSLKGPMAGFTIHF